jgi:hypothetical protein
MALRAPELTTAYTNVSIIGRLWSAHGHVITDRQAHPGWCACFSFRRQDYEDLGYGPGGGKLRGLWQRSQVVIERVRWEPL